MNKNDPLIPVYVRKNIDRIRSLIVNPPNSANNLFLWAAEINQQASQLYGGLIHEKYLRDYNQKKDSEFIDRVKKSPPSKPNETVKEFTTKKRSKTDLLKKRGNHAK